MAVPFSNGDCLAVQASERGKRTANSYQC